jgi:hypothetical protein
VLLFLDEVQALKAIKGLFDAASSAKIAVAFWGSGAVASLGLDRLALDIDVICNLDSGACNPIEIDKLRQLRPHAPVRSDPRLHGKVYWTPGGVVVGSSNASTNGLAVEIGLSGWAEANIQSDDRNIVEATYAWFEARKQNAYEITNGHIAHANELWNDRVRSSPVGLQLTNDIGAAVRHCPDHPAWLSVKLAVYSEGYSPEGIRALKEERRANPILRDMGAYEGWDSEIEAGDWLLDFELNGEQADFGGYWNVPTPKLESKLMTYFHKRTAVRITSLGSMKLSILDLAKLRSAAQALVGTMGVREPPCAMIPIRKAIDFIDSRSTSPASELKAFERAMLNIFKEATKAGYRPTEFLKMISRESPLLVAKRLIMSKTPSSGFTRLWELKRLDLTVEALALSGQWKHLFSQQERERAESRLEKYR